VRGLRATRIYKSKVRGKYSKRIYLKLATCSTVISTIYCGWSLRVIIGIGYRTFRGETHSKLYISLLMPGSHDRCSWSGRSIRIVLRGPFLVLGSWWLCNVIGIFTDRPHLVSAQRTCKTPSASDFSHWTIVTKHSVDEGSMFSVRPFPCAFQADTDHTAG
jgi:hypothetical protein